MQDVRLQKYLAGTAPACRGAGEPWAPWLAVGVVCFGAFMGQLDASIVTITFPAMQHDFGVPVAAVQWVSLVYLLGLVALLAPAGRLGDAVGRKLVYTYGFAVFTVASAACGLAPSLGVLVCCAWSRRSGRRCSSRTASPW